MVNVFKKVLVVLSAMIAIVAVTTVGVGIYLALNEQAPGENSAARLSVTDSIPEKTENTLLNREDMLEHALESVVGISSADKTSSGDASTWNMGSGIIADKDGYIITNHHVIGARPQRIVVTLYTGKTLEGKTVWSDSTLDLAIVKINSGNYTAAKLGDVHKLRVGESVVAIGNPLSMQFERTVTAGIVSALGRSINIETNGQSVYMEDLIQTDASINPGNSGGPLINSKGEVVAVNTIKVTTAEGMGFSVPINLCVPILNRLKSQGSFVTPYLGLYAYTAEAAHYYNSDISFSEGIYVSRLDTGGPAFRGGLRGGDILLSVDDSTVDTMLTLREKLFNYQKGDTVKVSYIRRGEKRTADITIEDAPKQ